MYPGPDPDQFQNLIDWFLAEDLSLHEIWFEFVNNPDQYPYYFQF